MIKIYNKFVDTDSFLLQDLDKFDEIEFVEDVDKETIIMVTYVKNLSDEDLDEIYKFDAKKIVFDYSSNDRFSIYSDLKRVSEKFKDKECKIISKSLDFKKLNHFYYDQQMFRMKKWLNILPSYDELRKNMYDNFLLPTKKGMFFVGHPRLHKINLLNDIYLNNRLDDLYWASSDIHYDLPDNINWGIEGGGDTSLLQKKYNNFEVLKYLPKRLDYYYDKSKHHLVSIGITINWAFYLDSCFDIVGETSYDPAKNQEVIHHVSEKILKPIMCGMPFVVLNQSNTIKKLEENFGFKFDTDIELFNHEYDSIEDSKLRMNAIKDKVNVILSKSKEELKELSYKYKMKTKHNREILLKVFWKKSLSKIWSYINE